MINFAPVSILLEDAPPLPIQPAPARCMEADALRMAWYSAMPDAREIDYLALRWHMRECNRCQRRNRWETDWIARAVHPALEGALHDPPI